TKAAITFLDTPGHAAFTGMRERGALTADIAVLVVSAEDGVKAQTLEALKTIQTAKIPFVVAINKIDRPEANIEKTKMSLAEHEIFIEGYGGTIPVVPISALTGAGIDDLLETLLLVAELEELTGDPSAPAEGIVIESRLDPKRGISGTIVITNGTLKKGMFVVAGDAYASTRIIENFLGKSIESATFSSPVQLVGFNTSPTVGSPIAIAATKREAEAMTEEYAQAKKDAKEQVVIGDGVRIVPVIIKADVYGTAEALEKELKKIQVQDVYVKVISKGIGAVTESDMKHATADKDAIILAFNVAIDSKVREMSEQTGITVQSFNIIYKLTEWFAEEAERRRPRKEIRDIIGTAKVLKVFSKTKERQVIGCRVEAGALAEQARVTIKRRDFELATGTIIGLEAGKQKTREVKEGSDCGVLIETKTDIAPGDVLEAFVMATR
ncbi:MAG TPA: GTP-binding protein, partial [Candidatus Paceibacterota bacterium]|nr:GTP-binding protein [Candidatus Paceibacterota bacterium]